MLNQIVMMGRLTRDPELRRTTSGTPIASFTIACDRDYKANESGERGADFVDCIAWRGTGEFVSKYFTKGRMAVVAGRLQFRDWTDKDGGKHRKAEINAEHIYFGDSRQKDDSAPPSTDPAPPAPTYTPEHYTGFAELDDDDGDLPF